MLQNIFKYAIYTLKRSTRDTDNIKNYRAQRIRKKYKHQ
jgi:hypothetical protein